MTCRASSPSLVSRIICYLLNISIEATASRSVNGAGQGPHMTEGHLELAWVRNISLVPAPDLSPGERVFRPAETPR